VCHLFVNRHLFYSILTYLRENFNRPEANYRVSRSNKKTPLKIGVYIAITIIIIIIPLVKVLLRVKKSKAGTYGFKWLHHYEENI
jgi:hypothetical protein